MTILIDIDPNGSFWVFATGILLIIDVYLIFQFIHSKLKKRQ